MPCRRSPSRTTTRRIEEAASRRLVEKFSRDEDAPSVSRSRDPDPSTDDPDPRSVATLSVAADGRTVQLRLEGETHVLDRTDAVDLRDSLDEALTHTREFVYTASRHREDGAYVVERRGADSAGHRKVFESFDACRRLYERLPDEFVAEDVTRTGVTGGRRHLLLRHFVEHPGFDCELVSRQPLRAAKADDDGPERLPEEVMALD